jgi:hypothetical protein
VEIQDAGDREFDGLVHITGLIRLDQDFAEDLAGTEFGEGCRGLR